VRALSEEKELLEAELSRESAAFRDAQAKITFDQLLNAVPSDSALVDYLEYGGEERGLIAFVVRHAENEADRVTLFDLGPVTPISAAIDAWRQTLGKSSEAMVAGQTLRRKIWDPLLPSLVGANTILVSPDGVLGRLPLEALPGSEPGRYLLEDHRITYISAPRLIPNLLAKPKSTSKGKLLLVGDVDYGTNAEGQYVPWRRLPGTAAELDALNDLFANASPADQRVIPLRGIEASERRVREATALCQGYHFATHGIFEEREEHVSASMLPYLGTRGADRVMRLADNQQPKTVTIVRSGLVLAGANQPAHVRTDEVPSVDADDGLLMTDEILTMPLADTRLVVMSACDTARGKLQSGEGLLGIQRAFQVAGAQTTVASLWQVDDLATAMLMKRFYQNLWSEKFSRLDALREAKLWVLQSSRAEMRDTARRAIQRGEDVRGLELLLDDLEKLPDGRLPPYYWAAFVLSGKWR
jgi:CHAT domain-containing protein